MFGYASNETDELMPLPIMLAHRLARRLAEVRKADVLPYLRPDGKTQVTVRYELDEHGRQRPVEIERVLISTQHRDGLDCDTLLKPDLIEHVIEPILPKDLYDAEAARRDRDFVYCNPTGKFVIGGPMGDTGLTGRKIIVDTYGGAAPHGGGAFSGKDPTKVDRSAAYAARWVAKNVVAAGLAERCQIQVAYAIGVAHPLSVLVDTFGTEAIPVPRIEELVREHFDLRPAAILRDLDLRRPIYAKTAAYGHFGREDGDFTWERTDRADALRAAAGLRARLRRPDEQPGGGLLRDRPLADLLDRDRELIRRRLGACARGCSCPARAPGRRTSAGGRRRARRGGRSSRASRPAASRAARARRSRPARPPGSTGQPCGQRCGWPSLSSIRSIISSSNVSPSSSARSCDSYAGVAHEVGEQPLDDPVLADDALGPLAAALGEQRLLLLAALDQALGLEPLQHLAGRGARDVEHLGDARGEGRGAGAVRRVLADREGEEVDRLEVLVYRVAGAGTWLYCPRALRVRVPLQGRHEHCRLDRSSCSARSPAPRSSSACRSGGCRVSARTPAPACRRSRPGSSSSCSGTCSRTPSIRWTPRCTLTTGGASPGSPRSGAVGLQRRPDEPRLLRRVDEARARAVAPRRSSGRARRPSTSSRAAAGSTSRLRRCGSRS